MTSEAIVWLLEAQNKHLCEILCKMDTTNGLLKELIRISQPPPPNKLEITRSNELIGVGDMGDKIVYDVNLPSLSSPSDVVTRELTIRTGQDVTVITVNKADTVIPGLEAPQDSHVVLELVDIDDAGNRSDAATYEFDAVDTFPPPKPGDFGVVIIGEDINPSPCP